MSELIVCAAPTT